MSIVPGFSVVVPCFNEQDAVESTLRELIEALAQRGPYELLVVDDGSFDTTPEILDRLEQEPEFSPLKVLRHEGNAGYGAAIKTGIRAAQAPLIVITDADGTYPNARIPDLLDAAKEADMVVGARIGNDVEYSWLRRIPKAFLRAYTSWLVNRQIPDMNSGLRVFRTEIAKRFFKVLPDGFSLTTTITVAMMRAGHVVRFVPVDYAKRVGRSKIQPVRDTLMFVQLILRTGMYFAPLRVLTPLIVVLATAFALSLGYDIVVLEDLTDKTVLLLLFTLNTALFGLLADMIDKRS